jgi:murein DD-endopeptidase MepM/ murein hydrolase activator NlpD
VKNIEINRQAIQVCIQLSLIIILHIISSTGVTASSPVVRPVQPADDGINQTYLYGEGAAIHRGVDFSNLVFGEAVLAAADGVVVDLFETLPDFCSPNGPNETPPRPQCDAYGNFVLIRHNKLHYDKVTSQMGRAYSLYLHLRNNSVNVNENGAVSAGSTIAQRDDTGNSSANHLHFQLIVHNLSDRELSNIDSENRTRNPELWLLPLANTARLAGKVTDAAGNAVSNLTIYTLQKTSGNVTLLTYRDPLKPDDFLVENFATTDITPGTYCIEARQNGNVYRNFGCNNVFVAGQTTYVGLYPVFLPDIRIGWTSSITIRNNSTTRSAQVNTTYFYQSGTVYSQRTDTIAANAEVTFNPPSNLDGSAMVVGSEDLAVLVVHEKSSPSYVTEAYLGVDQPTATVHVPIAQKGNSGWNSYLYMQNAGYKPTNLTVEFFPAPGTNNGNYAIIGVNDVQPGATASIYVGNQSVGTRFVGSVRVTNSQNQPIAVASTQVNGSTQMMETSNTQGLASTLYAPLIQNNNSGWISGLTLRSVSGPPGFVVQIYNNTNNSVCFQPTPVPGNPNPQLILPAVPIPPTPTPSVCPATPWGKFTASYNTAVNVNQLQGSTNATTYAAISTTTLKAIVPKVSRTNGWDDGFVILNASGSNATVIVNLYNTNGTLHSTPYNTTRAVGNSVVIFGATYIPAGFNGSAVITANQPIAVIANSFKPGSGDTIGSYPAIHR